MPTESITPAPSESPDISGREFWSEVWVRYMRRPLAVAALGFILLLALIALLAPLIAGTRPIICQYRGQIYFPFLYYFNENWEPVVFRESPFNQYYAKWFNTDLQEVEEPDPDAETDPRLDESRWAIWPLLYQDPRRPVEADEQYPGAAGNPQYGPPSSRNWFGTLKDGTDVFAQLIHGTRIALLVGFVSTGISAVIGIALGAVAGYTAGMPTGSIPGLEWMEDVPGLRPVLQFFIWFRSWADIVISRLIEVVMCVPTLVLILAMLAVIERAGIWHVMAVIGLTGWPGIARLTRAEFLKLSNSDYVTSARALGASDLRIIFIHILPNALAPVMVPIAFGIASAILAESGLSFLGFGAQPDDPSWGTLLSTGKANMKMWWLVLFPGLAIFFSVLSYNLIGEALQEVTDPRLREAGK